MDPGPGPATKRALARSMARALQMSHVLCHMSYVLCPMSGVLCPTCMGPVTCLMRKGVDTPQQLEKTIVRFCVCITGLQYTT